MKNDLHLKSNPRAAAFTRCCGHKRDRIIYAKHWIRPRKKKKSKNQNNRQCVRTCAWSLLHMISHTSTHAHLVCKQKGQYLNWVVKQKQVEKKMKPRKQKQQKVSWTYATKPPKKATGPPPIKRILRWHESKSDDRACAGGDGWVCIPIIPPDVGPWPTMCDGDRNIFLCVFTILCVASCTLANQNTDTNRKLNRKKRNEKK